MAKANSFQAMAVHKKEIDLEKRREQSRQQASAEALKHTEEVDQLLKIEEEIRDAMKSGRIDKIYNQGPKAVRKAEF
jgi:hypothetical protein